MNNTPIQFGDGNSNISITVPPVVTQGDYLNICGHPVKATFDLSKVPGEHHEMAMMMIQRGNLNLVSPLCHDCEKEEVKNKHPSFWRKLFKQLKHLFVV